MSRMSRRERKNIEKSVGREEPPTKRSAFLSPEMMRGATLAGVAVLIFLNFMNWEQTRRVQRSLSQFETNLTQLSAKVDQAAARPAAAPAKQGPDPSRVYMVKTDGAPFKGPQNAPITIAEFSEFQ